MKHENKQSKQRFLTYKSTWAKVVVLFVLAVFFCQSTGFAYSYKGTPTNLKDLFRGQTKADFDKEMGRLAAATAVGCAFGAAGGLFVTAAMAIPVAGGPVLAPILTGVKIAGVVVGAAAIGATGAYVTSRYVYNQDHSQVKKAAWMGAAGGAVSAGVGMIPLPAGGVPGAFYGGVIGGVAGAGLGYAIGGEQGAWVCGFQGAVAGAAAGAMSSNTSEATLSDGSTVKSSDNGNTMEIADFSDKKVTTWTKDPATGDFKGSGPGTKSQRVSSSGKDTFKIQTYDSANNKLELAHYNADTGAISSNIHSFSDGAYITPSGNRTVTMFSSYNNGQQLGVSSHGSKTKYDYNQTTGKYDPSSGTTGNSSRVYSTDGKYGSTHAYEVKGHNTTNIYYYNKGSNTYMAHNVSGSNGNMSVLKQYSGNGQIASTTWDNYGIIRTEGSSSLSSLPTTTTSGFGAKVWNFAKNSPLARDMAVGLANAYLTHELSEAIMGDIYLRTVDDETGEWDQEKAEFWSTVACATVMGTLNASTILGEEVTAQQGKGWKGALKTFAKGAAVGALSGLGSAYAVDEARRHMDRQDFEVAKPAIRQTVGTILTEMGRAGVGKNLIGIFREATGKEAAAIELANQVRNEMLDSVMPGSDPSGIKDQVDGFLNEKAKNRWEERGFNPGFIEDQLSDIAVEQAGGPKNAIGTRTLQLETPVKEKWYVEVDPNTNMTTGKHYGSENKSIVVGSSKRNGHFNVYSKERSWGQVFKNVASAPVQAVRAEGHRIAGTLAQSWAQKAMIDKAQRSGNEKWALYASNAAEAAGYITTALGEFGGNYSGFTYRSPLNKLAYNAQIKKELNDMARVEKNKKSDQVTDKVLAMQWKEPEKYEDYKNSDAFVKDLEDMGKYDEVGKLSIDDKLEILGETEFTFHRNRALVSIGRDLLSKTAPGAITAYLDDTMAKKAPEYWGGAGSTTADDFSRQEKYNEWQAKQALNRAYTLNMASSFFRGVGLWAASKGDEEMWGRSDKIIHNKVDIRSSRYDAETGKDDVYICRYDVDVLKKEKGVEVSEDDRGVLTITMSMDKMKEFDGGKHWQMLDEEAKNKKTWTAKADLIDNKVEVGDKLWTVKEMEGFMKESSGEIKRKGDTFIISKKGLQEQFPELWNRSKSRPASFLESVSASMAGSQIAPITRGLTFGYSGFYKEKDEIKQRHYTSAQWTKYLTDLQSVSGAFSSVASMRNYWANTYMGTANNNIASAFCTIEPVAKLFGFMPERAIFVKDIGYSITAFKNTRNIANSYGVPVWDYKNPYPAQDIIDPTIAQQEMKTNVETIDLSPVKTYIPVSKKQWERGVKSSSEKEKENYQIPDTI